MATIQSAAYSRWLLPTLKGEGSLLQHAQKLLAIPSVHTDPAACAKALDYVAEKIRRSTGLTIEYFERGGAKSFLAYPGTERPQRFKVLLNAHVDVVPARAREFRPVLEGDRLYARGALDMKVAALVMTEAFCAYAARVPYPLGLQVVTDEEPGGYNGAKYQYEQGVRADLFLTGEQSRNHIAVAAKGLCRVKLRFGGRSAHSAYLWRGDNAILRAQQFVAKLLAIYPVPVDEAWATTVNVSHLQATTEPIFNRVPDEVELHLDIRPLADDHRFRSPQSVERFFHSLDTTAEILYLTLERGHHVAASHPMLRQLVAATSRATHGREVKLLQRHGQSDIRHYNRDPDCIGLEFGLKGKHDHGDNEYVELSSIVVMQQALATFLKQLA